MAYTTQTFIKQAFLAASAAALMAAAVPAAYAAPQDGHNNAKQSRPNTHQTNRNTRRDNRQARNAETRRDNRQARRTEARRDNRQARRQETRREIRRDRRQDRRVQQRRAQRHYTPPSRTYARPVRRHNQRRNHYTPYRSHIGISFNLGSGYNQFRWAPTAYSFYRPSYGHYGNYQRRTRCRRVTLEAWRYGHPQLVSVKQCSNPWDGTYIVQGSERLVAERW